MSRHYTPPTIGVEFNSWVVIGPKVGTKVMCRCLCGREKSVIYRDLFTNRSRSCTSCASAKAKTTHGQSSSSKRTSTYRSWAAMLTRCSNTDCPKYKNYGARGIKVCDHWKRFENFLTDMGTKPTPKHTIERINNNGDYKQTNCRWATNKEQSRNRRNNHVIEAFGKKQTMTEWAEEIGIPFRRLQGRIQRGWTVERSLTTI